MKILVTGDLHIDGSTIGRVCPATGLDFRTEDFLKALDQIVEKALEEEVDLFIVNGDLFKGRTSTHHIETLVAEKFRKVAENTQLIINLGNHDYTPKQLAYGVHTYSILERLDIKNCKINLDLSHQVFDELDLVLYPYYDLKRVPEYKNNETLLATLKEKLDSFSLSKKRRLFVGHGTPSGTIINEDFYFDLDVIEEPIIPTNWFDNFDLALFSHIHRTHWVGEKVFHIGSPERVDFSEAEEDKGFVIYDSSTNKLNWHSTNPRIMYDLKLNLLELGDWDDPTEIIEEKVRGLEKLEEAMVKIQVECSEGTYTRIDQLKLRSLLQKCFYYKPIKYEIPRVQKTKMKEITEQLNPEQVLEKILASREDLSELDRKLIYTKAKMLMLAGEE